MELTISLEPFATFAAFASKIQLDSALAVYSIKLHGETQDVTLRFHQERLKRFGIIGERIGNALLLFGPDNRRKLLKRLDPDSGSRLEFAVIDQATLNSGIASAIAFRLKEPIKTGRVWGYQNQVLGPLSASEMALFLNVLLSQRLDWLHDGNPPPRLLEDELGPRLGLHADSDYEIDIYGRRRRRLTEVWSKRADGSITRAEFVNGQWTTHASDIFPAFISWYRVFPRLNLIMLSPILLVVRPSTWLVDAIGSVWRRRVLKRSRKTLNAEPAGPDH